MGRTRAPLPSPSRAVAKRTHHGQDPPHRPWTRSDAVLWHMEGRSTARPGHVHTEVDRQRRAVWCMCRLAVVVLPVVGMLGVGLEIQSRGSRAVRRGAHRKGRRAPWPSQVAPWCVSERRVQPCRHPGQHVAQSVPTLVRMTTGPPTGSVRRRLSPVLLARVAAFVTMAGLALVRGPVRRRSPGVR